MSNNQQNNNNRPPAPPPQRDKFVPNPVYKRIVEDSADKLKKIKK